LLYFLSFAQTMSGSSIASGSTAASVSDYAQIELYGKCACGTFMKCLFTASRRETTHFEELSGICSNCKGSRGFNSYLALHYDAGTNWMLRYRTEMGEPVQTLKSNGLKPIHGGRCEYPFHNDTWASPLLTLMAPSAVPSIPITQHLKQALILCVGSERNGWIEEQQSAMNFFFALGFQVQIIRDPDARAIVQQVKNFTQLQHGTEMAIAIMAHGRGGSIRGRDCNKVHLDELFGLLDSKHAPHLTELRKFLFVQACRREEKKVTKTPFHFCSTSPPMCDDDEDEIDADKLKEGHPTNFYLTYATLPGEVALRGVMFKHLLTAKQQHPSDPIETLVRIARNTVAQEYHQMLYTLDFLQA